MRIWEWLSSWSAESVVHQYSGSERTVICEWDSMSLMGSPWGECVLANARGRLCDSHMMTLVVGQRPANGPVRRSY